MQNVNLRCIIGCCDNGCCLVLQKNEKYFYDELSLKNSITTTTTTTTTSTKKDVELESNTERTGMKYVLTTNKTHSIVTTTYNTTTKKHINKININTTTAKKHVKFESNTKRTSMEYVLTNPIKSNVSTTDKNHSNFYLISSSTKKLKQIFVTLKLTVFNKSDEKKNGILQSKLSTFKNVTHLANSYNVSVENTCVNRSKINFTNVQAKEYHDCIINNINMNINIQILNCAINDISYCLSCAITYTYFIFYILKVDI